MADFAAATELKSIGDGRYGAVLDPQWAVADKLHGGYLLSLAGRAAVTELGEGFAHPLVASAHYLAAPEPGPAELTVEELRRGRRTAHTRVTVSTDGGPCVEALITCGPIDDAEPFFHGFPAPEMPPEDDCPRLPVEAPWFRVPLMGVVSERLDPDTTGWTAGRPDGRGELHGWLRFDDGPDPLDPIALLTVVDALPPAAFDLGVRGWIPTIALSCHIRGLPAPGPVIVANRTRYVAGGRLDEECHVWDSTGRLVATSSQLAGARHP